MTEGKFLQFPSGFLWGAATSAYQIEGSWNKEGRGPSIWDTFAHLPGKTYQGHNGDVAADHYQRWSEDVELMADLGLGAYRFSISWPRILPTGAGEVNRAGLDFYDRLVDALLDKDILPFITLYHWDLPQTLQDSGGWANRDTAYRFAEYARIVAARLGDRVQHWITHNEPSATALSGHMLGDHAPGLQDPILAIRTGFHLLLSHGLTAEALRTVLPQKAQIGITLNLIPVHPASDSDEDRAAAQMADVALNHLFLEPVFHGQFPPEIQMAFGPMLPDPEPGDFRIIASPVDFLGVNYYSRAVVRHDPEGILGQASQIHPVGNEYSQMWEVYPPGIYEILDQVQQRYQPGKIYITENGVPVADGLDLDGRVRDYRRIRFLRDHIAQVHRAIQAGIPVRGYLAWSLLDNFEWALGYQMRFGLIHIEFETQKRTVKESGRWYARLIQQNGLDPHEVVPPGC